MSDSLPRARPERRRVFPPEDPADLPRREDPFAAVPAFDPDAPPPPNALTVRAPEITEASLRERLKGMATELLTAPPARVKQLGLEIQRTRVAMELLNEADTGQSNPDTYKELSMLNRMLAGEQDLDPTGDEVAQAEAEALLRAHTISPETAARIMRVFDSLSASPEDTRAAGSDDAPPRQRRRSPSTH